MTVVNGVRVVSNSEVQTFKDCRRRWWLAWYRGLALKSRSVEGARSTGTRIHIALASYYSPGDTDVDPKTILIKEQDQDLIAFMQSFDDRNVPVDKDRLNKLNLQFDLEHAMLDGYFEWLTDTGEDADLEVIAAETYVEAILPTIKSEVVKLIGKLDARVRHRVTQLISFIDHKTVATLDDPVLRLNEQMKHYVLLEYLHATEEKRSRDSQTALSSSPDLPGVEFTTSVGMQHVLRADNGGVEVCNTSQGRRSHEQCCGESRSCALRMPQSSSQQGSQEATQRVTPSGIKGSIQETQTSKVDRGIEGESQRVSSSPLRSITGSQAARPVSAIYNMLKKTKRTARAVPPFFSRVEIRHNTHEINSYLTRITGVVEDMIYVEHQLKESDLPHNQIVYPTPSRDCSWKCDFFKICRMFDDGSRVEAAIEDHYEVKSPLSYYEGREVSGAV